MIKLSRHYVAPGRSKRVFQESPERGPKTQELPACRNCGHKLAKSDIDRGKCSKCREAVKGRSVIAGTKEGNGGLS